MKGQLRRNSKRVVGLKQTLKVIQKDKAEVVFLANDADSHIREQVEQACQEKDVTLEMVESKARLGEACGIDVGSATAAMLKNNQ